MFKFVFCSRPQLELSVNYIDTITPTTTHDSTDTTIGSISDSNKSPSDALRHENSFPDPQKPPSTSDSTIKEASTLNLELDMDNPAIQELKNLIMDILQPKISGLKSMLAAKLTSADEKVSAVMKKLEDDRSKKRNKP